jgi:ParB-like chromosome segregation protein Spo0J
MPRKATKPAPPPIEPLALEEVALADLKPHPQNYRDHTQDQLEHLEASLETFGVYKNIVIARDNTILAGHGLVESARQLGMTSLPVKRMDLDPQEEQALRLLVGDNETPRLALLQETQLASLLQGIQQSQGGLLGTGFDLASLDALITQQANAILRQETPQEFPQYDETIETQHRCPQCGYEWSGQSS